MNLTPPVGLDCVYSITPTQKTLFTIKNFQPKSTVAAVNVFIEFVSHLRQFYRSKIH
jgi:hypothetical protein